MRALRTSSEAVSYTHLDVYKRQEMNHAKWFWFAIGYQTLLAYVVSLCVYQIGTLAGGGFGIGTAAAFILIAGFMYLLFRPYKEKDRGHMKEVLEWEQ